MIEENPRGRQGLSIFRATNNKRFFYLKCDIYSKASTFWIKSALTFWTSQTYFIFPKLFFFSFLFLISRSLLNVERRFAGRRLAVQQLNRVCLAEERDGKCVKTNRRLIIFCRSLSTRNKEVIIHRMLSNSINKGHQSWWPFCQHNSKVLFHRTVAKRDFSMGENILIFPRQLLCFFSSGPSISLKYERLSNGPGAATQQHPYPQVLPCHPPGPCPPNNFSDFSRFDGSYEKNPKVDPENHIIFARGKVVLCCNA